MTRERFLDEYIMKGLPVLLENCLQSAEDYAMRVSLSKNKSVGLIKMILYIHLRSSLSQLSPRN